ncbi:hypothetical protein MCAG_02607 [Micromonospora sp. ATCC 39149]|nr:hypothetical protein MCAG_02607 [Micromonospora sp. ATCC 39149]
MTEDLLPSARHHIERHADNTIEADHSQLEHRLRPIHGLRTDRTAQTIVTGHAFVQRRCGTGSVRKISTPGRAERCRRLPTIAVQRTWWQASSHCRSDAVVSRVQRSMATVVTVTNTQFRRVYRNSGHEIWFVLVPAMLVGVFLVVRLASYDDVPVIAPIGLALMFAAAVGCIIPSVYRTATIADEAHLTIVGPTSTRQIAWRDVQGIEIELRRSRPSMQVAVVYDAAGGKRDLPHVNDHSLVTALSAEVGQLRRIWELRRGDDWKPTPPAAAQIAYDRRYPTPAWAIGLVGGFAGLVLGVALFFILLASDAYTDRDGFASTYLSPFVLSVGLPAAGAVLTGVAVAVRRRAG